MFTLVSCLSEAIDLVNPELVNHHKRVTYIANNLAVSLGLPEKNRASIFIAGLLHDIGAIAYSMEEKKELNQFEMKKPHKHAILGYLLLRSYQPFAKASQIIQHHHVYWKNGKGSFIDNKDVPLESHILHLADRVDISIQRNKNVLDQAESIRDQLAKAKHFYFHPKVVDSFLEISSRESFWLDITSNFLPEILQNVIALPSIKTDIHQLQKIAQVISRIIDFRTHFTATHSSGVAICAETLARLSGLPDMTSKRLGIAGYLHDIGKLLVPNEILNKPGRLTQKELNVIKKHTYYTYHILNKANFFEDISLWASNHHETLNGTGYPYQRGGNQLDDGSRIMAVADIFTALMEDRPYRQGLSWDKALPILKKLVSDSLIDRSLVSLLEDNYKEVNELRSETQARASAAYQKFWDAANRMINV